jgi:hypothetical protein
MRKALSDGLKSGSARLQAGHNRPFRWAQTGLDSPPAWTQNSATQAEVTVFILDSLWQSLPRPPFTVEDTEAVAERVYDHVWQRSAGGDNAPVS